MKILVAGIGNLLRGDDGFGVEVARALADCGRLASDVEVFEAGIAGIALAQELMSGYDALIVADAIDRNEAPGTIFLIEPEIPDASEIEPAELHRSLVDAHYAEPSKVLLLARALQVLPEKIFIIGCQPASLDEPDLEMSRPVKSAVQLAVRRIESLIEEMIENRKESHRGGFQK